LGAATWLSPAADVIDAFPQALDFRGDIGREIMAFSVNALQNHKKFAI